MERARFAEHLAVFADVCRLGSFSAAARRRAVTPSSVVRQIDQLEADLGVKLLTRSTRALTPTGAGALLLERARPVLAELADIRAELAALHGTVGGVLRVACLPTFGKRYVIPALEALLAQHPLRVELDLTERMADPVSERLDAVVRAGRLGDSALIATRLAPHRRRLAASPRYLARAGRPGSLAALARHRLLDKMHGTDVLGWAGLLGTAVPETASALRCDDFAALREAALSGFGIAYLPSWVIGEDIARGTLVALLAEEVQARDDGSGIYVLRALKDAPANVAAFTASLRAVIGAPPVWDRENPPAPIASPGTVPPGTAPPATTL